MKKLMIAFAAIAAFVSVASAEDAAWFTGTIGSEDGGSWTMAPGDGEITTNSTTLVLEDAAASFAATTPKALSGSENLNFATSAKFAYSYDELPEIDSGAKAGIVVYTNEYYVLAKDDTTNNWAATGIAAASLNSEVAVNVTISNDNSKVIAIYNIAGSVITKEVVAGNSSWGTVDYKGSGEVASLVGTTTSLSSGWLTPGGYAIEVDPSWAEANGINAEAFAKADKLANGFSASESYILGLNTDETLKSTYAVANFEFKIGLAQAAREPGRVTYNVYSGDSVLQENVTLPYVIAARGNDLLKDGRFKICPVVTGQTASGYSTVIGIKATDQISHNSCSFLAIPFECVPSNFLWVAWSENRVDTMGVYDAESEQWDTYLSKESTNTTVWDYVAPDPYRAPITTVLRPGQAIKLNCGDQSPMGTSRSFYIIGEVVPATTTAIVDGKWNLVGTPDGNPIQCSKLPEDALVKLNSDLDMLPSTSFYKHKGAWYRQLLNKAAEPVEYIGKIGEAKNSEARGFYLKSAATSIQW